MIYLLFASFTFLFIYFSKTLFIVSFNNILIDCFIIQNFLPMFVNFLFFLSLWNKIQKNVPTMKYNSQIGDFSVLYIYFFIYLFNFFIDLLIFLFVYFLFDLFIFWFISIFDWFIYWGFEIFTFSLIFQVIYLLFYLFVINLFTYFDGFIHLFVYLFWLIYLLAFSQWNLHKALYRIALLDELHRVSSH